MCRAWGHSSRGTIHIDSIQIAPSYKVAILSVFGFMTVCKWLCECEPVCMGAWHGQMCAIGCVQTSVHT